jgi:hypothetical protein
VCHHHLRAVLTCLPGKDTKRYYNVAVTRRTRRSKVGSASVDDLKALVDSLIKENRKLQRQLVKVEAKVVGRAGTGAARGIAAIARRVQRALGSSATGTRRTRRSASTSSGGTRATRSSTARPASARKPASPETQAKRLAALAKAREARAAKKAAAS